LPKAQEALNPWGVNKSCPLTARGLASRLCCRILNISFRYPSFDLSIECPVRFLVRLLRICPVFFHIIVIKKGRLNKPQFFQEKGFNEIGEKHYIWQKMGIRTLKNASVRPPPFVLGLYLEVRDKSLSFSPGPAWPGLLRYIFSRWLSIFAGRNNIAFINARNASAAIPTIRNGIDNSHTIGHKTSANSAIGQHSTNNIAHNSNITNTLIARLLIINLCPYYIVTRR
jgi:hypothetical protein